ncbi:uncharacterized protein SAPINGB_P000712 [Magnusiomyces paraingens]|uniref:Uncharacterized protein n=1 Tax=Magnusiomyces paraingens TaxID=2606893 RepID=A0A5E8B6U0_9ASCO|nr:uncharacterized protein SAPINGB_P000712 [Saprochaete ingens]VVT45324.1 unnamed protein product [Saprochaete ingens]
MTSALSDSDSDSVLKIELPTQYYNDFDSLLEFIITFPSYKNKSFVKTLQQSPQSIKIIEVNLETLKRFGRSPDNSRLITENHVIALINFIEPRYSEKICIEGLSILANALVVNTTLLNSWDCTKIFNLTLRCYVPRAPSLSLSERYLFRRLGFLFTYRHNKLNEDQVALFFPLITRSMSELPRDVSRFSDPEYMPLIKLNSIELLKVTFNVFHHYSDYTLHTLEKSGVMCQICKTLIITDTGSVENSDLTRYLFNCLMCSTSPPEWFNTEGEFEDSEDIFENLVIVPSADDYKDLSLHKVSSSSLLIRILEFAKLATNPQYAKMLLSDITLSPCLTCLQKVIQKVYSPGSAETESQDTPKIQRLKNIAESYLLPSESEREYPLGSLDAPHSLSNAFVRFSSDISLTTSTAIVQDIYWKLFYGREGLLVSKMGLGFASSFLSTTSTLFSGETKKADDIADTEQQTEVAISRSTTLVSPHNTQRSDSNSSKLKMMFKSDDDYKEISREGSSDLTSSNTHSPSTGSFSDYPSSNNDSITLLDKSDSSSILDSLPFFSTSPKPTLAKLKAKTKSLARGKNLCKASELDPKESEKNTNTNKSCGFVSKYLPGVSCSNTSLSSSKTTTPAKKSDLTSDKANTSKSSASKSSNSLSEIGPPQGNVKPINIQQSNTSNSIDSVGSVGSSASANVLLYPYISPADNIENLKKDSTLKTHVKYNDDEINLSETTTGSKVSIDPITGKMLTHDEFNRQLEKIQQAAKERSLNPDNADELEWTEEEKEKEAEKMFDLFERLNKNGVIKVANPSQVFQQSISK